MLVAVFSVTSRSLQKVATVSDSHSWNVNWKATLTRLHGKPAFYANTLAAETCLLGKRTRVSSVPRMSPSDEDALYKAIGERIRRERERQTEPLSQSAPARHLGVSRASVVNIEAGRQRAPLGLLWKIACQMDVELAALIPSRADMNSSSNVPQLTEEMRDQLRKVTKGDQQLESEVSGFIAQAVAQLAGMSGQPVRQKRKRST